MNLDVTFITSVYQLNKTQSHLADRFPRQPHITLRFKALVLKFHTTVYYFNSLVLTFRVLCTAIK